jgi:predicted O-linked N-acetylglucosamine transferase (SPINDLY family)
MIQTVGLKAGTELFNDSANQAVSQQLSIVDLFKCATMLAALDQKQLAVDLYKTWTAYNADNSLLYAAYFNYGVALMDVRDSAGAINAFRESIRLKPDFHQPYINLGRALEDSGQAGQAVSQWLALVNNLAAVNGDSVMHKVTALQQIGRVLEATNTHDAAEDALKQSIDLNVHQPEPIQHWIALRQRQCKWPVIAEWERAGRKDLVRGISSLSLANLADDPMFQLAKSFHYAKQTIGMPKPVTRAPAQAALGQREPYKIRVGYVSSDLRDHAVGFAMTDVVEQHDKKNFEIFAYYCGIDRTDVTQQRIMKSVDHWTNINGLNDDQAAAKIAADGIDILIDLNGYTKDARTKVFARHPAPIAVNWFGFPGTMGTPYHHYLIADPFIIPPDLEIFYSEKVVRLPCYQPNDRRRIVAESRPTRAETGLPEGAFVYCSLNGMQKITPRTFERWMTILEQVPGSVLWLLSSTNDADERLRKVATDRGIAGERIVFAGTLPNPQHLARYPLADLFLDTMPYGAHTTAADSLWMSVPILTWAGRSFASRVCASVVRAAGVGELVCATPEEYVARAIELGRDREKLAAIKLKLVNGRDTCLLFDTPQLVQHLEELYRKMWSDFKCGELPLPDLRNLEIYHEVGLGLGLDLENIEMLTDDAYRALYQAKFADWNDVYPIQADARLWSGNQPSIPARDEKRAVA